MRIDLLETFLIVASLKSISDAAAKLRLAQATVSHRMLLLQQELKSTLIERQGRGIVLTPAGALLLSELPKFLKTYEQLTRRFGAPEPETGVLRIGVIESVLHSTLLPWLTTLRREHPGVEIQLTVETTTNLIRSIEHGALDLIVATLAAGDGIRKHVLPAMDMALIGLRGLHKTTKYTLAELTKYDLMTFQVSSLPHSALTDQLAALDIGDVRVHAISSISAMRALVASGFGIATLPRSSLDAATAAAGLIELQSELQLEALPLCLSWHEAPSRPHLRAIVDSLERAITASSNKPGARTKSNAGGAHDAAAKESDRDPAKNPRRRASRTHQRARKRSRAR
jgi:DNA-binding transcriptional LysR family regulator